MCACAAGAIACIALARRYHITAASAAGLLLGYAWAALLAHHALAQQLAPTDEGRDITVIGIVDSLPYRFEQGLRFNLLVERTETPGTTVPPRIALSWYADRRNEDNKPQTLMPGERWRLTVRLQRPHGNANPGGFDYEAWLLEQGVRATGYVRAEVTNARLDAFVPRFGTLVERTRAILRDRILDALRDKQYAGVIVALVIGDQRGIDQSDWQVFTRTGIGHLISISGLHITMIAGLTALAASSLWRRSFFTDAQLPLRLPAQKVAALVGALTALLYVLLAGFGVPAQRTLYMLSVVALALWTGRLSSVTHVLCAALGVVLLFDPWAVLWPGFWLSFGAVAVILFGGHGRIGPRETGFKANLTMAGQTQWSVTLGLVPLTMLLFGQVSLVSPLANAVAIPLVSFIVTPLALLGSLSPDPLAAGAGARRGRRVGCSAGLFVGAAGCGVACAGAASLGVPAGGGRHAVDADAARLAASLGWRCRLAAAASSAARPSRAGTLQGDGFRRRPGHGAAGRNRRPPAAVRHRPRLRAGRGCRQPRTAAVFPDARHRCARRHGRQPQRHRSHRRRAGAAG
jgi:competence protein ComEC